jgi:putative acetyltransferase
MMKIVEGDLRDPRVIDLLQTHLAIARAQTPPESVHALDIEGLKAPAISFWSIWDEDALLGVGALKQLSRDHGEIKSMHTVKAMRRRGVGRMMLCHVIAAARARGMSRLSLETGSSDHFAPARALYLRHGFAACPPFADYGLDPHSVFMTLDLGKVG